MDKELLRKIVKAWGKADVYYVGGCVRDMLLGKEPKDYDLVVDMENGATIFTDYLKREWSDVCSGFTVFPVYGTAKFDLLGEQAADRAKHEADAESMEHAHVQETRTGEHRKQDLEQREDRPQKQAGKGPEALGGSGLGSGCFSCSGPGLLLILFRRFFFRQEALQIRFCRLRGMGMGRRSLSGCSA